MLPLSSPGISSGLSVPSMTPLPVGGVKSGTSIMGGSGSVGGSGSTGGSGVITLSSITTFNQLSGICANEV